MQKCGLTSLSITFIYFQVWSSPFVNDLCGKMKCGLGPVIPYLLAAVASVTSGSIALDSLPLKLDETQGFYTQPLEQPMYFAEALYELTPPLTFDSSTWRETVKSSIRSSESILDKYTDPTVREAARRMIMKDAVAMKELEWAAVNSDVYNVEETSLKIAYAYYHHYLSESCSKGLLTWYVISPEQLTGRLDQLQEELKGQGLELSFPHHQNLSLYFSHQLVQCVVSPDEIVVTLRVPVKRMESNYSVVGVTLVPFFKKNEVCVVTIGDNQEGVKQIVSRNEKERFLVNSLAGVHCERSLCVIPEDAKPNSDPCLETILNQQPDVDSLVDNCFPHSSCHGNQDRIPFSWSSADEFTIVTSQDNLNISCRYQGIQRLEGTIKPPKLGTLQIRNSCTNCAVNVGSIPVHHSSDAGFCDLEMTLKRLELFNVVPSAVHTFLEREYMEELAKMAVDLSFYQQKTEL